MCVNQKKKHFNDNMVYAFDKNHKNIPKTKQKASLNIKERKRESWRKKKHTHTQHYLNDESCFHFLSVMVDRNKMNININSKRREKNQINKKQKKKM